VTSFSRKKQLNLKNKKHMIVRNGMECYTDVASFTPIRNILKKFILDEPFVRAADPACGGQRGFTYRTCT
jgi:hypothetical protein